MARKKPENTSGAGIGKVVYEKPKQVCICHFKSDGQCKGNATIRINDFWICNWHYENGYDRNIRQASQQ